MCTSLRSDMAFRFALCSRRNAETDILIWNKRQKSIIGAGSRQQGMLRRGLRQQGGHLAFYCQISKDFRRSDTQHDVGDKRYKALYTTVAASASLDDMRRRVCGFTKQEEKALNWPLGRNKEMGRRKFTSLPSPTTASKGDGKKMPDESAQEGEKHPPDSSPPLFLCPAQVRPDPLQQPLSEEFKCFEESHVLLVDYSVLKEVDSHVTFHSCDVASYNPSTHVVYTLCHLGVPICSAFSGFLPQHL